MSLPSRHTTGHFEEAGLPRAATERHAELASIGRRVWLGRGRPGAGNGKLETRNSKLGPGLALTRVILGIYWIGMATVGVQKLNAEWFGPGIGEWLAKALAGNPYPWYASFLREVVVPNQALFAGLVLVGELAVGLALIVGLLTPPAALVSFFMNANFWLAFNWFETGFIPWPALYYVVALAMIILALARAGRCYGLDARLARRWPRSVLW